MKYGAYLLIPLKYDQKDPKAVKPGAPCVPYTVNTMDISENIKSMFGAEGEQSVGTAYRVPVAFLEEKLPGGCGDCVVSSGADRCGFSLADSFLYIFNTRTAFLCLGLTFTDIRAIQMLCNPGFAENSARCWWTDCCGTERQFSLDEWLVSLCEGWGLRKFHDGCASVLLEAYTYILALTDRYFGTLEEIRRVTFNLHKMQDTDICVEDESEADIRYVYAARNSGRNAYRWGCCVTSQTISYAVASDDPDIREEMETQAADGLPIVLLALYARYTCLRFSELIATGGRKRLRTIQELKKMMLRFRAFGTVSPANLSRWNNVRQIYGYLLEVSEIKDAVEDIGTKISILAEQQQELESRRSGRVVNLITIFGVVGIVSAVQDIFDYLSTGNELMWSVTALTLGVLILCFGIAMKK